MNSYELSLINQFKKSQSILINLDKVGVLTYLERELRKISNCTFRKYNENTVICNKIKKNRKP